MKAARESSPCTGTIIVQSCAANADVIHLPTRSRGALSEEISPNETSETGRPDAARERSRACSIYAYGDAVRPRKFIYRREIIAVARARARDLIKDRPSASKAERRARARARARGCPSFRGRKSFRAGANELVEREVILSGTADYRLQLPRLPALLLPDFLGSSADYNMVTGLPAVPRRASPRESGFFARESEQISFRGDRS